MDLECENSWTKLADESFDSIESLSQFYDSKDEGD